MATTIAVRTKQKIKREATAYNELALRQNAGILDYCRTSMSSLSGAAAGVLGLTGLYGFAFYFITAFILSFLLLMKAGSNWNKYFISRQDLLWKGLFGGLFTYVLCWTAQAQELRKVREVCDWLGKFEKDLNKLEKGQ